MICQFLQAECCHNIHEILRRIWQFFLKYISIQVLSLYFFFEKRHLPKALLLSLKTHLKIAPHFSFFRPPKE